MGKSILLLNIFSVLILFSVLWKPAYTEDGCKGSPSGPTFLNGHKYNYGVEGTVTIYLTGAEKQETSVKLLGQVSVSALGNCALVLKVQNLVISGPDGKKYNKPPGIEKPVRFTLEDGRLGSEIYAEEGDTRRSLNIKRAIISLLQTEQKPSTQYDIFGACPTETSSSAEGGAVLVHRTRDLSRCAHREQARTDLLSAVYNPTAEIKNTQVLQSTLNVETKVNNGVPEKVSATENYLYKPFSVGENGARAKVLTKLTLTGKSGGADNAQSCVVPRTIIFENPHGVKSEQSNFQSALSAVKETAKTCGSEASSKSAGNFAQVVRILRATSKDDLIKVYNQVKGNNLEKRVFLDGLLRTGTGPSIEASVQILRTKELSQIEQTLVYLSLGNAKHVSNEAIKAAISLLDLPNLPKEIYLGVGALAGVYCREHECHKTKPSGIVAISQKLGAKLQNCKPKTKIEEDNVVAVLKGIRSIRHLEDSLIDKVAHCAVDNNVKARVRVAALEAYHADPCAAKLKKTALDLLKNRQLDSEIRIKAYLAIIECPCGKSANEIKDLLESEPVHQVGRFITSSLNSIRASSNPDKALARQHYGLIRTPNKFNVDDRKYSFYREASYNIDALGVGGNIEESVIYSQNSFLPRSVSVNLTTELFGHNLNVLEIGSRQGNLDRVVEHFLGPKSIFRTKDPQDIYDEIRQRYEQAEKKAEHALGRGRRSVKNEVDNFDKHVKAESAPFNNELDLDIYIKLFGTDAVFLSLGDDKGFDFNSAVDQLLKVVDGGIKQVKHFQRELRTNLLFLDAELAYPTSTGFPLKLDVVGSAVGRFEVSTNIDIRQILRNPESAKVDVKLVPSTDVEVSGLFLVDADAVATGLKVITNLHSSTGAHVIAKVLENGRGIDLQLGLPVDKQEILTASNDLVYVTAEKGQKAKQVPLKIDTDRKEYSGCFDQLSSVLGLTLCGEVSVPFSVSGPEAQASLSKFAARYPLTGPSRIKLILEKNDLRGYHIKAVTRGDGGRRNVELLFEAEGSQNRRTHILGELVSTPEESTIQLSLESPIKTIGGQISLYTKPTEYALLVKAKVDAAEYYGRAGFSVQGNDQRSVYKPVVEYQLPDEHGKQNLKVDGQLVREINGPSRKYSLEGIKVNVPNSNEVIAINGYLTHEPSGGDLKLRVEKGQHYALLVGSLKNHDLELEFKNTLNPYVLFKIKGHSEFDETIHNSLDIQYGEYQKVPQNRVVFSQFLKYNKKSQEITNIITKNKFEIHALPLKIKLDAEVDPKRIELEVDGQYLQNKAQFEIDARSEIKKPGDYIIKVIANLNKQGVEIFSKRDIVSPEKSNFENYVQIRDIGKYELSGVVLHKTKANDINVGAIGHLKISGSGKNEDIKFDIGVVENPSLYSSHAKISGSQGQLLTYLLKITRGPNPNGQLELAIKNTIAATGQFKVTDNDGKGNGAIIIDFKQAQRKIKGDARFVVKDPVYNADIDLYLNFEKDNSDKVHISTNTKRTNRVIDSKNKVEYGGKKTEVNIHQDGSASLEGKSRANVEVVLPTERCLTLKVDRDLTVKNNVYNGHAEIILSDAPKRGAQASIISYKSKLSNCNFDKEVINYDGELKIRLKDGKQLQNSFYLKNTPEGDKSKFDFKSDINGNLIPQPASLTASIEYTNGDSIDGSEKYRLKGNYGGDIGFELFGTDLVNILDNGDNKYQEDYTLTLRLPFEKAHDIRIVSNVLLLQPQNTEIFEYTITESVQVNADVYKVDASGKVGPKTGFSKVKVLVPHVDPVSLDINYKANLEGERQSGNVEFKAHYGKGKSVFIAADASSGAQDYALNLKANAPQADRYKKLELNVLAKNPSPDTYGSNVILDVDGQVYKSESLVVYSKANPLIDVKYSEPNQPQSRLYLKGVTLSSSQQRVELKAVNIRGVSLESSAESTIQRDNVIIKVVANSKELQLNNYRADISTKDAGSGKRLEFHVVNDNKNVVSGSTTFISKQEGPKTIIEGSGSVKVRDEQKSANFKYIRTVLTEGNEQGVETFLNLALGDRSYVSEYRVTNLEYKQSHVYCEEKKQCAHAELQSKINIQKPGVLQHLLNIGLDLRKLGLAPEFGLQVSSEVSERRLPQYSLDLHINKEEKKYHLHAYSQPEYGKFPSGIVITLPQRVLALESSVVYPTDKALPFPIKGELTLNLDKNKPQQKSGIRFLLDASNNGKISKANAEIGLSHPRLGKEALIKVYGVVDETGEQSFKMEAASSISHPTLGENRESKLLFNVNPQQVKLLIVTPIVKVIDLEGSAVVKENLQQGNLKFSLLEGKPVQVSAIAKDFQYYEFTTGYSEEGRKLSIIGHLEPEKRVDISADIILPGDKKNILHGALYLKDNLVKTDYGLSKDNFNYFINALKKDLDTLEIRIKELGDKASAEFKNIVQRIEPKLTQIKESYQQELQKFYNEVSNDKVLKELSQALDDVVQFFAKIISEVIETIRPVVDKISETITGTAKQINELYEKQLEPQLKQLYANVAAIIRELFDGLIDIVAHFAAIVTDFFEKHKAELEQLTNTIAEIFRDLTKLIIPQLKALRERLNQLYADITQQIKELPIINLIQEKLQELQVPEQVLALLQEYHTAVRQLLPTEEVKVFADAVYNYAQKKLRQEKVDDVAELRVIYEKFAVALTSLVQFVRAQLYQIDLPDLVDFSTVPYLSGPGQVTVPSFGGSASASALSQLLQADAPDPLALVRAYRPRSLNPLDELPAKLRAVVVNGQHIFTFDGRHLTFPGSCRYVLAHDHVDRNFTLVLQLQGGQPKALILEDRSGTTVELRESGQVALNGQVHGFPVIENDVFAFRQANGRVGLGSTYGLIAFCTTKLEVCYIEVSGFYLGKLRGLLGDGNNEPFDDFRLPNGKITTSESEFGNAYKLSSSCPAAKCPPHSAHQHHAALPAACEQVFGGSSPLRPLTLIQDAAPFRQACIHAVTGDSANALQQACDLARGYAALAVTGLLPAVLPPACVRCTDADQPRTVGDTYEVKLPGKQADIIVTVETTKSNEKNFKEVVIPLVSQVVDNLKAKHIDDIKVYLVGVTTKFPYPIIYDSDLKLKGAKVQFSDASRYQITRTVATGSPNLDRIESYIAEYIDIIRVKLGLTNIVAGYDSILDLPLRPGAVKHAINVVGESCESQFFLIEFLRIIAYGTLYEQIGYTHSLVTITPGLTIGQGKDPSQVVGYTEKSVLLLGDKKQKESPELRATLDVNEDGCIDFVENTDGLILSATNYLALNPGQQKQFLQTAAGAITNLLLQETLVQECTCTYVDPFRVRSVCINKDRKEAARRRK